MMMMNRQIGDLRRELETLENNPVEILQLSKTMCSIKNVRYGEISGY